MEGDQQRTVGSADGQWTGSGFQRDLENGKRRNTSERSGRRAGRASQRWAVPAVPGQKRANEELVPFHQSVSQSVAPLTLFIDWSWSCGVGDGVVRVGQVQKRDSPESASLWWPGGWWLVAGGNLAAVDVSGQGGVWRVDAMSCAAKTAGGCGGLWCCALLTSRTYSYSSSPKPTASKR